MSKKETSAEKSLRNKREWKENARPYSELLEENMKELRTTHKGGKVLVPAGDDVKFWEGVFSEIEVGATLNGIAVKRNMSEKVMRNRVRGGELHEKFIEAHQGRAVYHAQGIEEMLGRLENGDVESDIARVSIDARKWLATKYYPRMFGDRQEVNVKTADMTKVYIEQLRMLMTKQDTRMKVVESREKSLSIEDKPS